MTLEHTRLEVFLLTLDSLKSLNFKLFYFAAFLVECVNENENEANSASFGIKVEPGNISYQESDD